MANSFEAQVKRCFRLTRSTDFKRVRRSGKSYAHPLVVLMVSESENPRPRLGLVVSQAVGGAVQRNRAKRLLQEAMRPMMPEIIPGSDLLLIARRSLMETDLPQIQETLRMLLHRAALLSP